MACGRRPLPLATSCRTLLEYTGVPHRHGPRDNTEAAGLERKAKPGSMRMDLSFVTLPSSCNLSKHYSCALREGEGNLGLLTEWDWRLLPLAMYKLNTIFYSKSVRERSLAFRSAAPAAAVHAAARHQRPLRPLPMAETGLWGPCVLPTHARSTAASTVDADIMLSMTSAVARHCISPRCCWYTPAGLGHTACRSRHSVPSTECRRRATSCTRPAVGAHQHLGEMQ